jgi:hypothetical protein
MQLIASRSKAHSSTILPLPCLPPFHPPAPPNRPTDREKPPDRVDRRSIGRIAQPSHKGSHLPAPSIPIYLLPNAPPTASTLWLLSRDHKTPRSDALGWSGAQRKDAAPWLLKNARSFQDERRRRAPLSVDPLTMSPASSRSRRPGLLARYK